MRITTSFVAVAAALALAAPAIAQEEPSVAGYQCQFAGQCGSATAPEDEEESRELTAGTRGFRLANAPGATASRPAVTAPSGRAKTTGAARLVRPSGAGNSVGGRTASRVGRRADLRISFELGSDRMTPDGIAKARTFAQALRTPALSSSSFAIQGHTDSLGSAASNDDLSLRRARSVADFLAAEGVERSRLQVRGLGSREPIPGLSRAAEANRRVEAELIR